MQQGQFPIYGLDETWNGPRYRAGSGASNGVINSITLAHGELMGQQSPLVRVTTVSPPARQAGLRYTEEAQRLSQQLWQAGAEPSAALKAPFKSSDSTEGWDVLELSVDGESVALRTMAGPSSWVALAHVGACIVTVEARHVASSEVNLATISDTSLYLDPSS